MPIDYDAYEKHVQTINGALQSLGGQASNVATELEHIGKQTQNTVLTALAERLHSIAGEACNAAGKYPKLSKDE